MVEKWFKELFNSEGLQILKKISAPYLAELKKFQFSVFNPILWIFFLLTWVILAARWNYKKSFSYCLTITIVLLANTQLEKYIVNVLAGSGTVDFTVGRLICGFVITFISVYYLFIRTS